MPRVARWLDQIRNFFPKDVVVLLQHDAIERRGMKELLFEPEIHGQGRAVARSGQHGAGAEEPGAGKGQGRGPRPGAARRRRTAQAAGIASSPRPIRGALDRNQHCPFRSLPNLDWPRTIRRNLKNYNPELKTIIPEHISFFSRQQRQNEWNVIIAMDQSGSMATSLIYGGIMGAILASMPAVETHVVAFNHEEVVDLTEHCSDPVDLLFGVQLGGAEDYWKATCYCERFMHTPAKTLYILLADLHDTSPNENRFVKKMEYLLESGVKAVTLAGDFRSGPAVVQREARGKAGQAGHALLRLHARSPARSAGRRAQGPGPAPVRRERTVEVSPMRRVSTVIQTQRTRGNWQPLPGLSAGEEGFWLEAARSALHMLFPHYPGGTNVVVSSRLA